MIAMDILLDNIINDEEPELVCEIGVILSKLKSSLTDKQLKLLNEIIIEDFNIRHRESTSTRYQTLYRKLLKGLDIIQEDMVSDLLDLYSHL